MIVEWYNGGVIFLETDKPYQISTNFVGSKYIGKEKPCWRYKAATMILDTVQAYTVPIIREALDATHLEHESSTTIFSVIFNLSSLDFSKPLTTDGSHSFLFMSLLIHFFRT